MKPKRQNNRGATATIAEVESMGRPRVAEIAGVKVDAVKLDLKPEYSKGKTDGQDNTAVIVARLLV